jgi:hypothetical protein
LDFFDSVFRAQGFLISPMLVGRQVGNIVHALLGTRWLYQRGRKYSREGEELGNHNLTPVSIELLNDERYAFAPMSGVGFLREGSSFKSFDHPAISRIADHPCSGGVILGGLLNWLRQHVWQLRHELQAAWVELRGACAVQLAFFG